MWDWKRYVIPNSKMHTKEVQNYSMNDDLHWANIPFYVAPDSDLEEVERIAKEVAAQSTYTINNADEPTFWVVDMQKDAIHCWIAVWAPNPSDSGELRCDVRKMLQKRLRKSGFHFQGLRITNRETEYHQ